MKKHEEVAKRIASYLYKPCSCLGRINSCLYCVGLKTILAVLKTSYDAPAEPELKAEGESLENNCKGIPLSMGKFAIVDNGDYDYLNRYRWYTAKDCNTFYARKNIIGTTIPMHRVIVGAIEGQIVDHINGNGLDNRKCNLRIVTNSQNAMNQGISKNNTTGYKGVDYRKKENKFRARIKNNGTEYSLGYFNTAQEAADAYDIKAKELFGEFAKTNKDLGLFRLKAVTAINLLRSKIGDNCCGNPAESTNYLQVICPKCAQGCRFDKDGASSCCHAKPEDFPLESNVQPKMCFGDSLLTVKGVQYVEESGALKEINKLQQQLADEKTKLAEAIKLLK